MSESVAALNAHVVGDGAEAVRGIEIAIAQGVLASPPQPLAGIGKQLGPQIVDVGAFAVKQLAEQALVNHAQDERLVVTVAEVLQDHAVLTRLL